MSGILRLFFLIILAGAAVLEARGARAEPMFALTDDVVAIKAEAAEGRDFLELQAKGIDPDAGLQLLEVRDMGVPQPPDAMITFQANEVAQNDGATTKRWMLTAEIKDLPAGTNQRRLLSFKYGTQQFSLPYLLTNVPKGAFQWTIQGPADGARIRPGQSLALGISVEGTPATNIGVINKSFKQEKSGELKEWQLCENATEPCGTVSSIPANSGKQIYLRLLGDEEIVGEYKADLRIYASEKPEGEALTFTVFGTSLFLQVCGVGLIAASVFFAWWISVFLRRRVNRLNLLLPVPRLSARVHALRSRMDKVAEDLPGAGRHTALALDELAKRLTVADLETRHVLPGRIPLPTAPLEQDADAFNGYLIELGKWITFLAILVEFGFEEASELARKAGLGHLDPAVVTATSGLDQLVSLDGLTGDLLQPPPEAATLQQSIDDILQALRGALPAGLAAQAAVPRPTPTLSYEQLELDLNLASGAMWLGFALVTIALGAYSLVFSEPGFGTPTDFLECVFWGFGLPLGAEQLKQSTPDTVKKALGIPLLKSS